MLQDMEIRVRQDHHPLWTDRFIEEPDSLQCPVEMGRERGETGEEIIAYPHLLVAEEGIEELPEGLPHLLTLPLDPTGSGRPQPGGR